MEPPGLPLLPLGPVALRPTGLLAAMGAVLALMVARRAARADGLDPAPLTRLAAGALGGGLVGAHLVHLLAYQPEVLRQDPWALLRLGDGLSSMGGLAGGLLSVLALRLGGALPPLRRYADALALGLAPGWAVGRIGCALARDHPGRRSDGWLALPYPGGSRLDLGLLEAVALALLAALLWWLRRRRALAGRLLPLLAAAYAAARLGLDALRATDLPGADPRLAGLTPAQWAALPLLAWGAAALARRRLW